MPSPNGSLVNPKPLCPLVDLSQAVHLVDGISPNFGFKRQLSHLMTKSRGGEAISKDFWQKRDHYHIKMPACCVCTLQFPPLQCRSYYKGCDTPAAGKGRRGEIWGGETARRHKQKAGGTGDSRKSKQMSKGACGGQS